jgi:hypothetical protein
MKKELLLSTVISFITLNICAAQGLLDSCFASAMPSPTFSGSTLLTNASDADLLEWTGAFWNGAWSNANVTIPPPCSNPPVRAVWIGDQTVWTTGGEAFGLKFSPPLIAGNTYTFYFTYVSIGFGSNGAFSPDISTNNTGGLGGTLIGNLIPAGYLWETHPFTFTADPTQAGDDYIIIHSNDGSGLVLNSCAETFTELGADSLTICYGDSAVLYSGNGFQSYSWNTGDTTNQITVYNSGTYISTNTGFCGTSSDTIVVTVDPCGIFPVAIFSTPDNHICPGTCTDFTNLSQNGTSYLWTFPGANPSVSVDINPVSICYNTPGTYAVELIATNAISSDTLTLNNFITVFALPPAQGIIQNGDTLFANQGAVTYQWFLNGNIISGATSYYYVAPQSGNYSVVAADENACEVEAVINNVIASNQILDGSSRLTIFPVPAFNELTVEGIESSSIANNILVYNMTGEKVMEILPSELKDHKINVEISSLTTGMYWIQIETKEKIIRERFLKK